MKIFVVNAYVRENGGDAALLSVLLKQVKQAYPDGDVLLSSMEDPAQFPEFEGVKNLGAIIRYQSVENISTAKRIMRKVLCVLIGCAWFTWPKGFYKWLTRYLPAEVRIEIETIMDSDVVIALGGGYLNGRNTIGWDLNVFFRLMPLRLAARLGKKAIFAPQSYGPFGNKRQERMARKVLNMADLIMVREQTSMDILKRIGVRQDLLYKTVDSGFAFEVPAQPDVFKPYNLKPGTSVLGITARRWLPPEQQELYERAVAETIDYVQKQYGMNVVLIPQVTSRFRSDDDRIVERRIADYCEKTSKPILVDDMISHTTLKAMYGKLDYLIGTRFHSVIFGLTSYVPSIAIEYEHKTGGIMHDLSLDEWVIKIEDVTAPKLNVLVDNLIAGRTDYLAHLKQVLPPYVKMANEAPELIRKVAGQ